MSGVRFTGFIVNHLLCIAVVGTDKEYAVHIVYCGYCLSNTFVHNFDCLYGCGNNTGMTYHVGVCEVDDNNIIAAASDGAGQLVAYFVSAHFRL